jgi:hypothetical protein
MAKAKKDDEEQKHDQIDTRDELRLKSTGELCFLASGENSGKTLTKQFERVGGEYPYKRQIGSWLRPYIFPNRKGNNVVWMNSSKVA